MAASFGKIYTTQENPRSTAIFAVAKANGLELELVKTEPSGDKTADYLLLNHLGKIPTFKGADNYVLTECIAIAIYITSQNEKTTLLGKTKQDYASIVRFMSFANSELLPGIGGWFGPLVGKSPYNKKNVEESEKKALRAVKVLEDHLLVNTYLVGERLTLADLFVCGMMAPGFKFLFDAEFRKNCPNVTRWYSTVYNQPIYSDVAPHKFELIEKAIPNHPPKSDTPKAEKAAKAEKPAEKPKAAPKETEEEDEAPAPKPKHPLDLLPRATFALDDWKRKYSNSKDVRVDALPWFWENMNFGEYSIFRVDYKYNDELTVSFMSSNLVGGFFTRLEGSRKHLFGCASVYGGNNDSIIRGAFVTRGHEALPAFDVAPDYDSYEFTKLDPSKKEDREFVDSMWSWDMPIEANGKEYKWSDGKVFK